MPRYEAPEPFSGSFVEYSDAWSVGQRNKFWNVKGDEFLTLLRTKVVAVHLDAVEGDALITADAITEGDFDRLDVRLYEWFRGTWVACLLDVGKLGEALRRALFDSYADPNSTQTTPGE